MVAVKNKDTGEWLSFPDFTVTNRPDWDDMDIPDDQLRELVEWKTDGRIPACDVEAVYGRIITEDELEAIERKAFEAAARLFATDDFTSMVLNREFRKWKEEQK